MPEISAVVLFCEDIREEKSGTYSIIGVLGDNMIVPGFPGAMPKLGVYIRINIPIELEPQSYKIYFTFPDGNRILANSVDIEMVEKAIRDAKDESNLIAGIYSQMIASPLAISQAGRFEVDLEWAGGKKFLGSLKFMEAKAEATAPSA